MRQVILEKLEKVSSKLMNLEDVSEDYSSLGEDADQLEKIGVFKRDFGMEQWDWPQGVGLFGLSVAQKYLTSNNYAEYIESWYKKRLNEGIPCKNINTTAPMMTLMDFDFSEELSKEWLDWVENGASRTEESGLQHDITARNKDERVINSQELWVDTLVMTNYFIAKMGKKYNNLSWVNESVYQLLLHTKYLHDKKTNLFFHGWTFEERNNFGGVLWCRGNCWATISIPLTLKILDESVQQSVKSHLLNYYKNQVDALLNDYLDKDEYMWHTVLTNKESYVETSGTAGILAGIYLGIKHGYLNSDEYLPICTKILEKLLNKIDENGVVLGVSAGTPVMRSEEDYMNIVQAPIGYGQALMLLVLSVAMEFY